MTKEQFIVLGLTEDQATKAAAQSTEELKTYIPKHRFDEVSEENKTLKGTVKKNEEDLEALKKSSGDAAALTKQIEELQKDNKTKDETHQAELKELKLTNAIKLSIAGKVHDEDMAAGLFDKSKLILGEDGKITGLDDQLKTLQESKKFLFKEDTQPTTKPGFIPIGSNGNQQQNNQQPGQRMSMKDAIAAQIQAQQN
jgi:small-conductance mechanosensitive channel